MDADKRSKPITKDSTPMEAENQDMAFVEQTLAKAEEKNLIRGPYRNDHPSGKGDNYDE
ncbi:hypothetical protein N6H14_09365 [Paenibacillus sp. CC-CFT747]|nr:hypothetical protein N6H14_09365 [Paenibacillus sp. CC-CFT747]